MLNAIWQYLKVEVEWLFAKLELRKINKELEDNKYLFKQVNEMIKEYQRRTRGY